MILVALPLAFIENGGNSWRQGILPFGRELELLTTERQTLLQADKRPDEQTEGQERTPISYNFPTQ